MANIVIMPKLGFDMAEGTLVRWIVQEGEPVKKGGILAEIETDKATVEVESAYEGVVYRHLVTTGEIVPVNTPIAVIADSSEQVDLKSLLGIDPGRKELPQKIAQPQSPIEAPPKTPDLVEVTSETTLISGEVKASPLARRMASELKIDIRMVPGTGPGGRISKKDIESYLKRPTIAAAPQTVIEARPPATAEGFETQLPTSIALTQEVPLHRLRKIIGKRMVEAKQQVPHFYITHEYDVASLLELRQQFNALFPEDERASVNDFILKAVALTLRQFPNLNASFNGDKILQHGAINIGVAVAVEGGLLTVVCHDADRKTLKQIALEMRQIISRARQGKVKPEDIEGSTFSVSNMGMFDVEHFIAIINPPEAAILAVGSARQIPVVEDGQIQPGWRMKATISVDHRVSDGAEAARFLQALALYLEEPLRILV